MKKMLLAAGLCLQFSGTLFADAWSDAVNLFGGLDAVTNNRGSMSWTDSAKIAHQSGTPQALAVGLFMTNGNPSVLASRFKGSAPLADLLNALQNMSAPVRSGSIAQPVAQPVAHQSVQPQQQAAAAASSSSSFTDWLSGLSSSSSSSVDSVSSADMQAAVQAQQNADAAAAATNSQAIAAVVNSGKSGVNLYAAYVDVLFNLLQQAVSAIVDPVAQQQVLQYIQNKAAKMSASVAGNNANSRTLGRMASKKAKPTKHSSKPKKSK